jgi:hypothetical protein
VISLIYNNNRSKKIIKPIWKFIGLLSFLPNK